MTDISFEQYLFQADAAVQIEDWASAIAELNQADRLQPANTMVVTALGSCFIQSGDIKKSVGYFERVVDISPEVFEAQNNLGVAYTLAGEYAQAEKAFRKALQLEGENLAAWKNLAQVCLQQTDRVVEGTQILASMISTHPEDVDSLLMMANLYEETGNLDSSDTLYDQALSLEPELKEAVDGKARIALVRSRQARMDKPKRIKKMAAPQIVKTANPAPNATVQKVIGYGASSTYSVIRLKRIFSQFGLPLNGMNFQSTFDPADLEKAEFFIFSQPNLLANLMRGINACLQSQKPFGVDLEQDFFHMPTDHPAYAHFGPGNPQAMKALELIMNQAEWVSVTSTALADAVRPHCKVVKVVLPGWDGANPAWNAPRPSHTSFQIGWIGSAAERADLLSIKLDLVRFFRENPRSMLMIAGDAGAYEAFGSLSENRKLFLPFPEVGEIPYLLAQFDVLLVPWRNIPYNQAKSDLALVEAGASQVPWVASSIPAYRDWAVGGILAEKAGDWFAALNQLASGKAREKELGAQGQTAAEARKVQ